MLGKVMLDAGACEGGVTVPADVILADGAYANNENITALILPDSMATMAFVRSVDFTILK